MSDKILLTKEQAKALIGKRKDVHTFRSGMNILIGADWRRKAILEAIDKTDTIEIGGDQCKKMGHALVIWTSDNDPLFVECDKEEIAKLEKSLTNHANK
jgi:hypothetical protein